MTRTTRTLDILNHNGCNFATEATEFPVFNGQEYCGQIHFIAAWAVPDLVYEELRLSKHLPLYVTSNGQWAAALEIAEHLLITQSPPTEFRVKGASLGLFANWPADKINAHADYRLTQTLSGCWEVEDLQGSVVKA